jgi:hypothetical protein
LKFVELAPGEEPPPAPKFFDPMKKTGVLHYRVETGPTGPDANNVEAPKDQPQHDH